MTDDIEDTLQACRDFVEEASREIPYDPAVPGLLAMIDSAIAARKLEKGLAGE